MNVERVAGLTALVSGVLFMIGLIVAAILGPAALGGTNTSWMGTWPMGVGMMSTTHMGGGTMGIGPGMMGFGSSGPASTPIPGATDVRVQAANFSFTPNEIHLPKSTSVNLTLTNAASSGVVHDFTVPTLGIHIVANPGETKSVGLSNLAAGRYDAYCSVPGHADLGMRATVIVE